MRILCCATLLCNSCGYWSNKRITRSTCYAVVSIADEFPHLATDRKRQYNDHLCLITTWAPDARSPREAAKAIKERLCAKAKGVPSNISLTGFSVTDVRLQYQNATRDERGRGSEGDHLFGITMGLRVLAYPTS